MKIHVENHHGVEISRNLKQLNRENLKGIFGTEDLSDSDEDPSFDPANEVKDDEDVNIKKRNIRYLAIDQNFMILLAN